MMNMEMKRHDLYDVLVSADVETPNVAFVDVFAVEATGEIIADGDRLIEKVKTADVVASFEVALTPEEYRVALQADRWFLARSSGSDELGHLPEALLRCAEPAMDWIRSVQSD